MTDRLELLREAVDLMSAEASFLTARGPAIRIYTRPSSGRVPRASDLDRACIAHRAPEFHLSLSTRHLHFFHACAVRQRQWTAAQMSSSLRADPFYGVGGRNGHRSWRIARTSIRQYVRCVRSALAVSLAEAGLGITAEAVLTSKPTSSTESAYRLEADVTFVEMV